MLPESKNIQILADNVRALEKQIHTLDVEIPSHAASDSGKILAVDSDGDLEWRNETPYIPPAYSTEEVNTGQKWIDGKDIYALVIDDTFPIIESASNVLVATIPDAESIIDVVSIIKITGANIINRYYHIFNPSTKELNMANVATSYSERNYSIIIRYTKVTESKSKKGGNKK